MDHVSDDVIAATEHGDAPRRPQNGNQKNWHTEPPRLLLPWPNNAFPYLAFRHHCRAYERRRCRECWRRYLVKPVDGETQTTLQFITLVIRHATKSRRREQQLIAFTGVRRINDGLHEQRWNEFDILRRDAFIHQQRLPRPLKCSGHHQSFFSFKRHNNLP
jgi:hypothetical protein